MPNLDLQAPGRAANFRTHRVRVSEGNSTDICCQVKSNGEDALARPIHSAKHRVPHKDRGDLEGKR